MNAGMHERHGASYGKIRCIAAMHDVPRATLVKGRPITSTVVFGNAMKCSFERRRRTTLKHCDSRGFKHCDVRRVTMRSVRAGMPIASVASS